MTYQRTALLVGTLLFLILLGATGYHYLEGWSYTDSLYMTVIVLSTVGLGIARDMNSDGKVFTIGLILLGVVFGGYALNALAQHAFESSLRTFLGKRRMEREIKHLKDHFILCGSGRVGRQVIKEFTRHRVPFVVIEKSQSIAEALAGEGFLTIHGDAADEEILLSAGIQRARGLVAAISTDADNVYVTLTAKGIRPDLMVVTRAQEESAEKQLRKAGANKVILPAQSAGQILAQSVLRPNVAHFIETVTAGDMASLNLQLEEILISAGSTISGLTLQQSMIRQNLGIIILAMKKKGGVMGFNPKSDSIIESGDCLIALGVAESMRKLEELAS